MKLITKISLLTSGSLVVLTGCVPDNYESTYYGSYSTTPAPVVVEHHEVYHNYEADRLARENHRLQRKADRRAARKIAHANAVAEQARYDARIARENRRNAQIHRDAEFARLQAQQQRDAAKARARAERNRLDAERLRQQEQRRNAERRAQREAQRQAEYARQESLRQQEQQRRAVEQARLQVERDRQASYERAAQKRRDDERRRLAEINARQTRSVAKQNAQATGNTPLSSNAFKDELAAAVRARNARQGHRNQ